MTDIVYLRSGEKCKVLYRDSNVVFAATRIVHDVPYGDDCETIEEDGQILCLSPGEVFDSPPTQVLSEEVEELTGQIDTLKSELFNLKHNVRTAKKDHEEKMEWYARRSSALARLDEFLDGRVTYYFVGPEYASSKPKILTVEETIDSDRWKDGGSRLLSLTAKRGRDALVWMLNKYNDGSGHDLECIPCTSHDEALVLGQQWIDERVAGGDHWRRVIELAREHGLSLPEGYVAAVIKTEECALERQEQKARKAIGSDRAKKVAEWERLRSESEDLSGS